VTLRGIVFVVSFVVAVAAWLALARAFRAAGRDEVEREADEIGREP
jgi:hypothetical protein